MKKSKKTMWAAWVVVLMMIASLSPEVTSLAQGKKGSTSNPAPDLPLSLLFVHPEAAAQPTNAGNVIRTLHDFAGKLYSGYGDWNANTGPIVIRSYDPATNNTFQEFTMRTEQIGRFVTVGNRLYAAGIDPGGGGNEEFAFRSVDSEVWTGSNSPFGYIHVFDIASLDGQGIWLFGSTNPDNACSYHSSDGGTTWDYKYSSLNLDLPGTTASQGSNRLFFGGIYKGKVYTQSKYYSSSRVFNPVTNTWAVGPSLLPQAQNSSIFGSRPLEFAGKMVYCATYTAGGFGSMYAFDGTRVTEPLKPIMQSYQSIADQQIYGGYLYVLAWGSNGGAILRTANLTKWELAGRTQLGSYPYSFRILNGIIYVGGINGQVFSAPLPSTFVPLN